MSTQIATGRTVAAPASHRPGRWMPWIGLALAAVVAVGATVALWPSDEATEVPSVALTTGLWATAQSPAASVAGPSVYEQFAAKPGEGFADSAVVGPSVYEQFAAKPGEGFADSAVVGPSVYEQFAAKPGEGFADNAAVAAPASQPTIGTALSAGVYDPNLGTWVPLVAATPSPSPAAERSPQQPQ